MLVKAVLTSVVIYFITVIDVPAGVLKKLMASEELTFGRHATKCRVANARSIGI